MGDEQVERMNRTIINMLKTLNGNQKSNWKKHVSKMSFAYNSTVNKATGFSPFYLMFGRSSRLPIDLIFGIDVDGNKQRHKTHDQFVNTWETSMQEALKIVDDTTKQNRRRSTVYYNKKVFGSEIQIGDRVLLRNMGERGGTGKLRSYWEEKIYVVVNKDIKLPIFTIRPEEGGRERGVHRNNITNCNFLPHKLKKGLSSDNDVSKQKAKSDKISLFKSTLQSPLDIDSDSENETIIITEQSFNRNSAANIDNSIVTHFGEESDNNNINIVEEVDVDEGLDVHDHVGKKLKESVICRETQSPYSESTDESDEHSPQPTLRKSGRARKAPVIFTYDQVGGNPRITRRDFR